MLDTILFDLDGTLVPVYQEKFTNEYFKALAKKVVPMGYDKDAFIKAIWTGTKAMQTNNGSALNREVFWSGFAKVLGEEARALESVIDEFYSNEFNEAKVSMEYEVDNGAVIKGLKEKGFSLVLATNPLFPAMAVKTRLSWAGIDIEDFDYISLYDNSRYCKPSLGYYKDLLSKLGKSAENCIMIGNNPQEDGVISELGVKVFIVNDVLEGDADNCRYPSGSLSEAVEYALSL